MDPAIEQFLRALKADGRSSPSDWQQFHSFLERKRQPRQTPPSVPLILAASGESNASKHERLGEQLVWASEHGCLDEALDYLNAIPRDQWNSCAQEQWHQDSYLRD